jgi:NAD-dependent SIR2 family protein deacetylase
MKPHCMFFDESYSEHYYRRETVMDFVEKSDCLLVIGTALMTALANKIVDNFLDKQLPVIEINVESAINRGNYIQVEGK